LESDGRGLRWSGDKQLAEFKGKDFREASRPGNRTGRINSTGRFWQISPKSL
jgi:hypothetical protein